MLHVRRFSCFFFPAWWTTLPETNSVPLKSLEDEIPFGMAYFQGPTVSVWEGIYQDISSFLAIWWTRSQISTYDRPYRRDGVSLTQWIDDWMDGWMDGWMDVLKYIQHCLLYLWCTYKCTYNLDMFGSRLQEPLGQCRTIALEKTIQLSEFTFAQLKLGI